MRAGEIIDNLMRKGQEQKWHRSWYLRHGKEYHLKNKVANNTRSLKWNKDHPEKARESVRKYNRHFKERNPEKYRVQNRLRVNTYQKNLRVMTFNFLGSNCEVHKCQANEYSEDVRFLGLSPHHLDGVKEPHNKRDTGKEYRDILSGKQKRDGVMLLCGFHHNIADRFGKKKWLEFIELSKTGAIKELRTKMDSEITSQNKTIEGRF